MAVGEKAAPGPRDPLVKEMNIRHRLQLAADISIEPHIFGEISCNKKHRLMGYGCSLS